MSNNYSFTTSCDLDIKGFEENYLKPKEYRIRIAMNMKVKEIKTICNHEGGELQLNGCRYSIIGSPSYFKEGNERGIYVNVKQIISNNNE